MSEVPEKFVTKKEPKLKKPKDPSPFKEYAAFDSGVWIPFVRIGYFDDWNQRYVIEGRVRKDNDAKRVPKKWATVGHLSGNLMVFEPLNPNKPWMYTYPVSLASDGVFKREIERYAARAREWFKTGNPLRELHRAMAIENGTIPKADTPLSQEEVKYD